MATKLIANNFTSGSITANQLIVGALSPILKRVDICDASYNVLDDTAANTGGGYIQVTGTNFTTNSVVVINTTTATSTTYVNNTTLRAQVPAFAAASYPVYVIDTYDGSTAIRYNGITFSNTPIWGTGTTLTGQTNGIAFGINLSATSDSNITYSNTTALPAGTTLAANGYFSGTSSPGSTTTYNFTVKANDVENQDASRTFSVTVTLPPTYLWSWGYNGYGQLGQNNVTNRQSPVQVGTDSIWSEIAVSDLSNNSAATKTDGTLWTWGYNNNGQLGQNNIVNKSSPVQVGSGTTWSQISYGGFQTDNNLFAIKTDGTLWSWGKNSSGMLGQNDTVDRSSPTQIGLATNWSKISAGGVFVLAIKTDGTLWGWGASNQYSLGLGNTTNRSSPVQIGALTNWNLISNGVYSSLAIKTDGTLWAWGGNSNGQLGISGASITSPTNVGALTNWSKISARGTTTLAIKTDGTLWSWGYNGSGQLGIDNITQFGSPKQVGSGTTWSLISLGGDFSLAIKTDGTLWAWGVNNNGSLGQNNTIYRSSPVQIGANTLWTKIAAGGGPGLSIAISN